MINTENFHIVVFSSKIHQNTCNQSIAGLIVVGGIFLFVSSANSQEKKRLWSAYQLAIKSGNKRDALAAGRAYYAKARGGKLTIYDEQALTNDLSTMV